MDEEALNTFSYKDLWKRVVDFSLALLLICILSPLLLLSVAIISYNSFGPVLFTQERIGLNMTPFRIFKFRTMRIATDEAGLNSVTVRNDPRVFRGASFLRASKLDEMPQLFNIVRGDMSFVGPRPTVMEDYKRMTEAQKGRSRVRPGLTGLAQINGNTSLTWPQRIEYDLRYAAAISLWTDLKIMVATGMLVLSGKSETHPSSDDEWS